MSDNREMIRARLDPEDHEALRRHAFEEDLTYQQIVVAALRKYLSAADTPESAVPFTGKSGGIATDTNPLQTVSTSGLSPEEIAKVQALVELYRDGDEELIPIVDGVLGVARMRHERKRKAAEEGAGEGTQHQRGAGTRRRSAG